MYRLCTVSYFSASVRLIPLQQYHCCHTLQHPQVLNRRRNLVDIPIGNTAHYAAQDLARPRLGQAGHHDCVLEGSHRPDALSHRPHGLLHHLALAALEMRVQHDEAERYLTSQLVSDTHHCDLGDIVEIGNHLLHGAAGEPVSRHIQYVICAAHNEHIPLFIDVPRISRVIVTRYGLHVRLLEALRIVVQSQQSTRGQGQLDRQITHLPGGHLLMRIIQYLDLVSRTGRVGGTVLDGLVTFVAYEVGADGPAGLGLPPVVSNRHAQGGGGPLDGVGISSLPGQEYRPQAADVEAPHQLALLVDLLDGPQSGRCREQAVDAVALDDPPEVGCIWGAHGLSLV
mmetsp:Transcript_26209/g.58010  ORF Transcript_26209/g.58010 Transcript_26209/m.58010 type:complete len:341 (+) Transcript_26209:136-1158(+)